MPNALVRALALAATAVLVPLAAGCGSSNDNEISKSEFLKKGNAICKKGNKEIEQTANKTFKGQPSPAELKKFATDTLIPNVRSQLDQIKALGAPKGDKDQVDAILNEANAALAKGEKDPTILTNEKKDPFKKANKLARDYGLTVCGSASNS
jgi:hypothetical protein